ncbi:Lrp/AsnC family transcriptional regulator [Candidatus Woesearchaeota archaeon]|nr:Lrp/AsnC family transcriptional regulator [Candidatus Woesearchaeota archaeon]
MQKLPATIFRAERKRHGGVAVLELKTKERVLLSHFRKNARESLTAISRRTRVPVSTIFDKLKHYEQSFIRKHTTLVDFSKLGYLTRANVMLKVGIEHRSVVRDFLMKHEHVNSLFKVNNGYDFLAEMVFQHIKDLEDFLEMLEQKFDVKDKTVFYIIEDICREEFMAKPELVQFIPAISE